MTSLFLDLNLNHTQEYFDKDGTPLMLCFDVHETTVDGILIKLNGLPLLKNEINGKLFLPDASKEILKRLISQAKKQKLKQMVITPPADFCNERYSFCKDFNFLYSSVDYEFIPGLTRPWNKGFLAPVFFSMDVLNKYSQNPNYRLDLFSSTYGTIRNGDEWDVQFGVNKNKKVIMWLGDLDGLPEKEKYYLLSENVESDHDIHSEFYNAQIEVQWADASVEVRTFMLRKKFSELILKIYGSPFNMLEGEISNVIENLDKPIFWEDKHVSPVVEALNRVFVESINIKELKPIIKKINPQANFDKKGSLKIVTEWFGETLKMPDYAKVMCPFYVLYDFRVMVCHLQSNDSKDEQRKKINERLGLPCDNKDYESIYNALFNDLEKSLSYIYDYFSALK